jgi:serine/threonine protein kinase
LEAPSRPALQKRHPRPAPVRATRRRTAGRNFGTNAVIHRDLKPANIKITPDDKVKVLDFGLAKLFRDEALNPALSNSPTMMSAASMPGMILGTAAYMSPEQARGNAVDKRTDVCAFGVVLFELLTGRPVFEGETLTDVLRAIVTRNRIGRSCLRECPSRLAVCCAAVS